MRISEAAQRSGLNIDTIRFYEKSGLLPPIERDGSGLRRFTSENVEWLTLLYWLRKTGMSITDMARFASMYQRGEETVSNRKELLMQHSKKLEARRRELDACEKVLAHKVALYDQIMGERS